MQLEEKEIFRKMGKIIVDAMGDACPLPVVKTKNAIKEMTESGTVEIHVDNEIAVQNLTKMANVKGYPVQSEKLSEQEYKVCMQIAVNGEAVVLNRVDGARNLDIRKAFALKGHGRVCLEPAVNAEILHRFAIGSVQCRVALHINIPEGFARQAAGNHIRKVRHAGHAIGDAAAQDGHQAFL